MQCRTQIRNEIKEYLDTNVGSVPVRMFRTSPNDQASIQTFAIYTGLEENERDALMSGNEVAISKTLKVTVECFAVGINAYDVADEMSIEAESLVLSALGNLQVTEYYTDSTDTMVTEQGNKPAAVAVVTFSVMYRTTNLDPENFI